ncbi:MAG: DNA-3-methyladenine glycosylase [Deferrisomatales bacterium]|nr:DNA-3-methyladenine glycosylase [Deferrisomatales bacterium]
MNGARFNRSFFDRPVLTVARELLGTRLVRGESGHRLAGRIVETEAYDGTGDLGCHARAGRTARNASMWGPPGHAYVYFTYGMHWLLNLVTGPDAYPAAVLLRAMVPEEGEGEMVARRGGRVGPALTDGPAKLCQALGIGSDQDGLDLCAPGAPLWIEAGTAVPDAQVVTGSRVGLNSVPEPWKSIPWRFRVRGLAPGLRGAIAHGPAEAPPPQPPR